MTDKLSARCGLTIGSILASGVRAGRNNSIVTTDGARMSYSALQERIAKLGKTLFDSGVRTGTRVAVLDRDSHRYLEAYFAVPMLGATLMTANIRLSPAQLRYTLEHSESAVVIAAAEFLPLLEQALEGSALKPRLIVCADGSPHTIPASVAYLGDYEALLGAAGEFEFPQVDEEAIATHFYTTGTTGLPKGVCYTHRQLVEHTLAVGLALASADDYQSLRVGDVYLPLTPMFHVHAWGMPYLATLLGLKQVYPGRFDPKTIPALIVREGITYSHCVPTILQMILDEARQQGMTFSGWKVMVGGSAMVPALASRALQAGIRVFAGYGMSETCPVVCFARADAALAAQSPADLCRVGQPVPLVDLRLWGDDVEDGELVARAPWLTRAYVKDEHGTERLWEGGYLHTGDVARIDDDGAVRIVDRLKDVIKSGGEWISSLELERLLREHGSVEEAAVIGVPDDRWGECPRAFVKLSAERAIADDTVVGELTGLLLEKVRIGTIPRFAIPKSFVIVEDIPKTSVGKIDKKRLRTWEDVPDEQR